MNILPGTGLQCRGAIRKVFIPDAFTLRAPVDAEGEQVAGKGFAPGRFTVEIGLLKGAAGDPVFVGYEDTGFFLYACGHEVADLAFKHPPFTDDLEMLLVEILLDNGKCLAYFFDFIVQQRSPPAAWYGAAGPLATFDIALES